jgi:GNAT superfamily N-acetyltransferase
MIRKASVLDISAITYMLNTMHKETELNVSTINTFKLVNKINEIIHTGIVLVAIQDNKLVGSIGGTTSSDWWSEEKHLSDLWFYVYKDARKSGIAKNLITDFIKIGKEAKVKIRLGHIFSGDVDRKDKFYERLGLVKAGSTYVEV